MTKTALIVDDSRSARFVLKRVLEKHNLDIDTSESAEDALEYLNVNHPDVIFMDHQMPGMDGFEAVSAIKKNPQTATIPIMMYTSRKGEVYVGQARALGAVGVLPKEVAPVEVSKVLKHLHIIEDDKQEHSADNSLAANDASVEKLPGPETLDRELKILIQDLFEQQRAIIHRELTDSYELIATRVADEIRPPPLESLEVTPTTDNRPSTWLLSAALLVLGFFTISFAWLHWQSEQSRLQLQAQIAELQRTLEEERNVDTELSQQETKPQPVSGAEESLQALQQISEIQQSLDGMYAVTLNSLQWGVNQVPGYHYGDLPLDDNRLKVVEQLNDHLLAIDFSGVVRLETHVANYCLTIAGAQGYVPAANVMASDCHKLGIAPEVAYEMGLGQSVAFASFIRLADEYSNGQIRYEIMSLGNSDPLLDYPGTTSGVTADSWNQIAAINNRVVISIIPDSY